MRGDPLGEAVQLVASGLSVREAAEMLGVAEMTVLHEVKRRGGVRRLRGLPAQEVRRVAPAIIHDALRRIAEGEVLEDVAEELGVERDTVAAWPRKKFGMTLAQVQAGELPEFTEKPKRERDCMVCRKRVVQTADTDWRLCTLHRDACREALV
jgi:transposase